MRRLAAAVLLALAAPAHATPLPRLPRHFLLGVATAAYQYQGGTTGTNWNAWEQAHPGTDGRAIKHYLALLWTREDEARSDPRLRRRPARAGGVYRTIARHREVTAGLLRRHPGPPPSP